MTFIGTTFCSGDGGADSIDSSIVRLVVSVASVPALSYTEPE